MAAATGSWAIAAARSNASRRSGRRGQTAAESAPPYAAAPAGRAPAPGSAPRHRPPRPRPRRAAGVRTGPARQASRALLEQLAADQHAPDLARPRADLVELGVAQEPPGRIVVDVAVAAEQLDGVERHLRRLLRRVEDRGGGVLAR